MWEDTSIRGAVKWEGERHASVISLLRLHCIFLQFAAKIVLTHSTSFLCLYLCSLVHLFVCPFLRLFCVCWSVSQSRLFVIKVFYSTDLHICMFAVRPLQRFFSDITALRISPFLDILKAQRSLCYNCFYGLSMLLMCAYTVNAASVTSLTAKMTSHEDPLQGSFYIIFNRVKFFII